MNINDTYNTITKQSQEVLFKDKNSKFFGYAFPVKSEEEIKSYLENLENTRDDISKITRLKAN